ncbi:hypothetical protein [Streptomyces sp. NPDC007984]|uniref:hypothetical protein n=1 Tax=Streptomyces sp. NPDC007984 TaxID=3364801 RepID=UPI0036E432C0
MGSQDQHRQDEPQTAADALTAAEERRQQQRDKDEQDAVAIDQARAARRDRLTPGGTPTGAGDAA